MFGAARRAFLRSERLAAGMRSLAVPAVVAGSCILFGFHASSGRAATNDWPRYQHDLSSSGFTNETAIGPGNASALTLASGWPVHGGGTISTQPVIANNLVYWGSWDGYERATPVPGSTAAGWATDLGQTSAGPDCFPSSLGVASTGAIASVTPAGRSIPRSVLFVGGGGNDTVGGGQAQLYALDAFTGAVLWHTPLGGSPSTFMWSSPVVYTYRNGWGSQVTSVYVGVSSLGDCPLVQAAVVQLDASSGHIQHVFDVVPTGCTGGSVWGSPTIDASDGSLYVATGNDGDCPESEPYTEALVKLRASDLSVESHWQVPPGERTVDSDFGSTPTLFSGTVTASGPRRSLVGVSNKNGIYYVFDRAHVDRGPLAELEAARSGGCPECGDGSLSPSAWDGKTLYVAGGGTVIQGITYDGNVRAWNPNDLTGAPLWQRGLGDGPVLGAVVAAPGIVAVGEGSYTDVLSSRDGSLLLHAPVSSANTSNPAIFYGAPSIACGALFEGDTGGDLYAYSRPGSPAACPPRIMGLRVSPSRLHAARRGPSTWSHGHDGAQIRYTQSEPGTVSFTVEALLTGRRRGRSCVADAPSLSALPRCTRYMLLDGSFKHADHAGLVRLRFTGRLLKHTLEPGAYRLTAVVRTRTGRRSAPARVRFTIRR